MRRTRTQPMTTWVSRLAFVAAVLLWAWTFGAPAQTPPNELTPTTALARTFVRESGIRAYERSDPAAIHAVVEFRSESLWRVGFMEGLRRATHGSYARTDRPRPWIVELWPGSEAPDGRPRLRRHWRRTYRHAIDVRRRTITHGCVLTPHAWGNYYDGERYQRRNPTAIELDCGQTCTLNDDGTVRLDRRGNPMCNRFFHLPRYARFDEE